MRIGNHVLGLYILCHPLVGSRWAFCQLPFIAQKHVEVAVVPGGGIGFPRAFNPAGGGVHAFAGAESIDPAQALFLDACALGLGAYQRGITCSVRFAKGVTTCYQGNRFFVVHGHACKGFAHITARGHRIRFAVRAFRIHVDQAHLDCSKRVGEIAITRVAAIGLVACGQPGRLGAPINVFFRFPNVRAATGKAEGFEAHGFQRHVTGQDHQVGP